MKRAVIRHGAEAAQEQLAGREEGREAFGVMGNHPGQEAATRGTQPQLRRKRKRITRRLQSRRPLATPSHRGHDTLKIVIGEPGRLDQRDGLDEPLPIDVGKHRPAWWRLG